ncbi:hypothetical protein GGI17_005522 [Coemansia sp. S146]|nr:hypothetical protein GGI17_005522 [Coemansia sp. S146]
MYNSKSGVTHTASSAHISDDDMSTYDSRSAEGPAPCVGTEVGTKLSEQRAPANNTGDYELSSPLPTLPESSTLLSSPQHKELSPPPQHEELPLPPSPLSQPEESLPLPVLPESSPLLALPEESSTLPPLPALPKELLLLLFPRSPSSPRRPTFAIAIANLAPLELRLIWKRINGLWWKFVEAPSGARLVWPIRWYDDLGRTFSFSYEPEIPDKPRGYGVTTQLKARRARGGPDYGNSCEVLTALPTWKLLQGTYGLREICSRYWTLKSTCLHSWSPTLSQLSSPPRPATLLTTTFWSARLIQAASRELATDVSATALLVAEVSKDFGDSASTSEDPARDKQKMEPVSDVSTVVLPVAEAKSVDTDDVSTNMDPASSGQPAEPDSVAFTTVWPVIKTSDVSANQVSAIAPHASREHDTEPVSAGASTLAHINVKPCHNVVGPATDDADTQHAKSRAGDKAKASALNISVQKDSEVNTGGSDSSGRKVAAPILATRSVKLASSVSTPMPSPIAAEVESKAEKKEGAAILKQPAEQVSADGATEEAADTSNVVKTEHPMKPVQTINAPKQLKETSGDDGTTMPAPVTAKASQDVGSLVVNDAAKLSSASRLGNKSFVNNLGKESDGKSESDSNRSTVYSALDSIIAEGSIVAEGPARNSGGGSIGVSIVVQPLRPVIKSDPAGQDVVLVIDTNDNVQPTVLRNGNSGSADGDADMQDTESPKGTDSQTVDTDTDMREARLLDTDTDMREARLLETDAEMREVVPLADDAVMHDAELLRGTGTLHMVEPPPADVKMEAVRPPVVELKMEDAEPLRTNADLQAPELPDYDENEVDEVLPPPKTYP